MRDDVDLLYKYKTFRPERTRIAGSDHYLYANPREPRGRALLRTHCKGQPGLKRIWQAALRALQPALVLDVGANYGEFLYLPRYPHSCRVIAIEADPALLPYLERARAEHPNRDDIELICAAATDRGGDSLQFFVDADWSGRSSVAARPGHKKASAISVPTVTIDSLCGAGAPCLLFKIDVENHEPEVLAGMQQTLTNASQAAGLLEFDAAGLRALGKDPDALFAALRQRFTVWSVQPGQPPRLADDARDLATGHADLVVASDRRLGIELGLPV